MKKSLLLVLAVLPLFAQAQVYRWVDEKGKVHFGDRPLGTENSRVRGLIDPRVAAEPLPKPGMKADEVRATYGEPERIRTISTKNGETEVWAYAKGKRARQAFQLKIEGGEVTELVTDTESESRTPAVASNAQGAAKAAADADYQRRQEMAQQGVEEKERRCTGLRERLKSIENQQRRGGSASEMESLREQKRQQSEKLWSEGC